MVFITPLKWFPYTDSPEVHLQAVLKKPWQARNEPRMGILSHHTMHTQEVGYAI